MKVFQHGRRKTQPWLFPDGGHKLFSCWKPNHNSALQAIAEWGVRGPARRHPGSIHRLLDMHLQPLSCRLAPQLELLSPRLASKRWEGGNNVLPDPTKMTPRRQVKRDEAGAASTHYSHNPHIHEPSASRKAVQPKDSAKPRRFLWDCGDKECFGAPDSSLVQFQSKGHQYSRNPNSKKGISMIIVDK
jgi:hypothetical protein